MAVAQKKPDHLTPIRDLLLRDARVGVILLLLAPLYVLVTRLLVPYFGAKMVEAARGGNKGGPGPSWLGPPWLATLLQAPLLGMAAAMLAGWLLELGMTHLRSAVRINSTATLRRRMFARLLPAFRRDLRPAAVGDALTRMQRAPDALSQLQDAAYGVFVPLLYLAVVTAVFLWKVPAVGGLMLALLTAIATGAVVATLGCGPLCHASERAHDNLQERCAQTLSSLLLTYVTGTERQTLRSYDADVAAHARAARRCGVCHRDITTVLRLVIALAVLGGLALVARAVAQQRLSPMLGVTATIILLRLASPLYTVVGQVGDLLGSWQQLQAALTTFENNVSDVVAQAATLGSSLPPPAALTGAVMSRNLHVRVARGSIGVRRDADGSAGAADVAPAAIISVPDFAAPDGGALVLVTGPIGSGKSCLLRALAGLHPYDGQLAFGTEGEGDGGSWREVRDVSSADLPRLATYVPQTPVLVSGTVRDNLALGNDDADLDERAAALDLPLPPLDQDVGRNGEGLSGGQRLVVAVARALLSPARVIAADEPTSALHGALREAVLKRLVGAAAKGGRTVFVSSHHGLDQWRQAAGRQLVEVALDSNS